MKIDCSHCGKELDRFPSRIAANPLQFCDMACMGAFRKRQVDVACEVCGKSFTVKASRSTQNNAITCSPECLAALRSRNIVQHHDSAARRIAVCGYCGKQFTRKPSQIAKAAQSYCSRSCKLAAQSIPRPTSRTGRWFPCETCGAPTWRTPATLRGHVFCSRKCAGRAGQPRPNHPTPRITGPDHWNWKGGISPYSTAFRLRISAAIRERDNNTCQHCGKATTRKGSLVVHHIDLSRTNDHPDNLITLCRPCHMKVHAKADAS